MQRFRAAREQTALALRVQVALNLIQLGLHVSWVHLDGLVEWRMCNAPAAK